MLNINYIQSFFERIFSAISHVSIHLCKSLGGLGILGLLLRLDMENNITHILYNMRIVNTYQLLLEFAKALVDFISWAITDGQKSAAQLGYVPLPAVVVKHNQDTLKSLTFIGTPLHTGHLPRSKKRITYVSKIGDEVIQVEGNFISYFSSKSN